MTAASTSPTPSPSSSSSAAATRPLAIITGASSGIGMELARLAAMDGKDLILAADRPELEEAAAELRAIGTQVTTVHCDLATPRGVAKLVQAAHETGRPVAELYANAGHGLGRPFLSQDFEEVRHVIDTNITGTLDLIQQIAQQMIARGEGRILVTGSIAGFMPGPYQAVYSATKAFINSFASALRVETRDSDLTITTLMPGATETEFFARADMLDTGYGASESKAEAADVAKLGYEALKKGEAEVIHGWSNRLQVAFASVASNDVAAAQMAKQTRPGSAEKVKD